MLSANVNEPVPLQVLAADGRQDLFGRVRVYADDGDLVTTMPANHVVDGIYGASWTPDLEGYFTYVAELFFDAAFLVPANYERQADLIEVSAMKSNVLRLLGLSHDNSIIDQQSFSSDGQLLQARIRVYDSKVTAQLASTAGLRFVYSVHATYSGSELSSYKILREQ